MTMVTAFVLINAQPDRSAALVRTHTLVAFRAYSRRDLEAMWSIGSD